VRFYQNTGYPDENGGMGMEERWLASRDSYSGRLHVGVRSRRRAYDRRLAAPFSEHAEVSLPALTRRRNPLNSCRIDGLLKPQPSPPWETSPRSESRLRHRARRDVQNASTGVVWHDRGATLPRCLG
jgi:hypothetical protein